MKLLEPELQNKLETTIKGLFRRSSYMFFIAGSQHEVIEYLNKAYSEIHAEPPKLLGFEWSKENPDGNENINCYVLIKEKTVEQKKKDIKVNDPDFSISINSKEDHEILLRIELDRCTDVGAFTNFYRSNYLLANKLTQYCREDAKQEVQK